MAKKLTSNGPALVGADIGYGYSKVVAQHDSVVFPSLAMHGKRLDFAAQEIASRHPGEQIHDEDGSLWFVGTLAQSQGRAAELIQLRGRTADEGSLGHVFRLRMLKAAIGKLYPRHTDTLHLIVATGLPVAHMNAANELKAALVGQHRIQTDQSDFVANITQVMVMPQPYGTLYSKQLKADGQLDPCFTATRTAVFDAGTYTLDLGYDDNGEYIDSLSGSREAGVYLAHECIARAINQRLGRMPSTPICDEVLRTRCLRLNGESHNFADEVEEATQLLVDNALALLNEKLDSTFVDEIYLTGGGANLIYPAIRRVYSNAVLVDNSQTANARGYLNYALNVTSP